MTIAATPDQVWAVLSDVRRMPEWYEDLAIVDVIDGDGRSPGSRFTGTNQSGSRSWSMTCVIDCFEEARELQFHTENEKGEPRTRWWYRLEATAEGTVVREGFLRVAKLGKVRAMAERKLLGDRTEYNARNIDESLRRLAQLVEA